MWISNNSKTMSKGNGTYCAWIHSHVRGNQCFFSSVDLHTQYAFELTVPHILGLVIELNASEMVSFDFYKLSESGKSHIANCNATNGLHPECSSSQFYQSIKHKVNLSDSSTSPLYILDGRHGIITELEKLPEEKNFRIKCYLI